MTLISVPEAANLLGKPRNTVWRWVKEGRLQPVSLIGEETRRPRALFDKDYILRKAEELKEVS